MQKFKNLVAIPDVSIYKGLKVDKDTQLKYERKDGKLKTEVKNLKYTRWEKIEAEQFTRTERITVKLKKGMVVIFESPERGLVVPQNNFVTISEAKEDYECIEDLGDKEYTMKELSTDKEE